MLLIQNLGIKNHIPLDFTALIIALYLVSINPEKNSKQNRISKKWNQKTMFVNQIHNTAADFQVNDFCCERCAGDAKI